MKCINNLRLKGGRPHTKPTLAVNTTLADHVQDKHLNFLTVKLDHQWTMDVKYGEKQYKGDEGYGTYPPQVPESYVRG